ncbi:MAG: DUF3108 domain-containing protein [Micavibrio sp.]
MSVFLASVLACFLLTSPARAAEPVQNIQKMTYEVYAGGINAVSAELDVVYKPQSRYSVVLSAFTKGFLGTLAPWKGVFETHGWRKTEGTDQPELHRSTATWRDEDEVKEYSYDSKGNFTNYKVTEAGKTDDGDQPEPELTAGTIDVLTATLNALQAVGDGKSCAGKSEIFDGSRRFELNFRFEAEEDLIASRYNVYQGPSQRCVVEVTPGAGKWHSKPRGWLSIQEQGRQQGSLPTVWFAQLDPNGPAVPVKIRIKSEYGAMFMHLVHYTNGNAFLTADVMDGIRADNEEAKAELVSDSAKTNP